EVPPRVRDAVLARAAKLPPEAREVLEIASLVPGRAERWLLDAADSPVEAAARSGIVHMEGGAIVFRHASARRAIEEPGSDLRRPHIQRAILAGLIEHGDVSLARRAHHAVGAENPEAVRRFAPLAAAEAVRAGAHREAAAHFRAVLRVSGKTGDAERAALL